VPLVLTGDSIAGHHHRHAITYRIRRCTRSTLQRFVTLPNDTSAAIATLEKLKAPFAQRVVQECSPFDLSDHYYGWHKPPSANRMLQECLPALATEQLSA
jgi:hypothetical protein